MRLREKEKEDFLRKHNILKPFAREINYFDNPELYVEFMNIGSVIPQADTLESYSCLEDAAGSEFFAYFLELDKRTDKKVQEIMNKLDDTREYGTRFGIAWHGDEQLKAYIEMFNNEQPELREYFQIVEYMDGTCRYSATHESCFMQIEMGKELYEAYFGYKREPEYYINTDKNDFSGKQIRYRFIFNSMQTILHEQMMKNDGVFNLDSQKVFGEKVEFLIEQATICHQNDDNCKSIALLKEAIQVLEKQGAPQKGYLSAYICTCFKIAISLDESNDSKSSEWWQKIYDLKDAIIEAYDSNPSEYDSAISAVANVEMVYYRNARKNNNFELAIHFAEDVIELVEKHNACSDDWALQFEVYGGHAVLIEDNNLEVSMVEYRKALTIARNYHLDQNECCALAFAVLCNNYAWVLWNKCGTEEAILYYGRAIDLLESYLFSGIVDRSIVCGDLKHVGSALNRIYLDTSRMKESEQLRKRLAENGIILE